jgi:5-formyltetrahydrofolate cyclo-ligase
MDKRLEKESVQNMKKSIRKRILEERNARTTDEISEMSGSICGRLLELKEYQDADIIMAYMDFRNEVQTGLIISESMKRGKSIALPVTYNNNGRKELKVYLIKDCERDLIKCSYGILEPNEECAVRIEPTAIDIVLVPGVAFGEDKNRLGYGAGYYDGFLPKLRPGVPKIALSFEMQILETVPADEGDVPMDMIITEQRIIR